MGVVHNFGGCPVASSAHAFVRLATLRSQTRVLAHTGGTAELKQSVATLRRAFPDMCFTIEELIAEGDAVASRWSLRYTHLGEYEGIAPTGKVLMETGITIFHFAGGKIVDDCYESSIPDVRPLLVAAG